MSLDLKMNKLSACVKVAACVCGKDGVISELEEQAMYEYLRMHFPGYKADDFELAFTEFFDSNQQIEDYLALIDDKDLRQFAVDLAEVSASADGLNIKENIALEKACVVWGLKHHA
ncbi:MAG: hypothetical protein V7721_10575 [Porticoccaceae bacterium]